MPVATCVSGVYLSHTPSLFHTQTNMNCFTWATKITSHTGWGLCRYGNQVRASSRTWLHVRVCVCLRVFYVRARAVMSSCVGERPRDANERGQHTTRTDVLTAQFLWEPAPTPPLPTTTNISLLLPSLLIAPARAWQAPLMPLASSLCKSKHSWWSSHISYSSICLPRFPPSVHVKCVCMGKSLRVWIFSGHVR